MPKMITVRQLADRLCRSRYTVYKDVRAGRYPAYRTCPRGHLLFVEEEVLQALRQERVELLEVVKALHREEPQEALAAA